jgi:PDZ domain-containing secreted protein
MFELRTFGEPLEFQNSLDLTQHLKAHHVGDHVAVTYKRDNGMKGIVFVTVTESGIRESHGNQQVVNFDSFIH